MKKIETIVSALRDALIAYNTLAPNSAERAIVAQHLFGLSSSRSLLPQLDELAHNVHPAQSVRK